MRQMIAFVAFVVGISAFSPPAVAQGSVTVVSASCPTDFSYEGTATVAWSVDNSETPNVELFVWGLAYYNPGPGVYSFGPTLWDEGYSGEDTATWISYEASYYFGAY